MTSKDLTRMRKLEKSIISWLRWQITSLGMDVNNTEELLEGVSEELANEELLELKYIAEEQ